MRFLGNKTKLLKKIEYVIEDNNIDGNVFCDLFAGSSSVGDFFKGKYKIIANDYLYCLSVIAKGKLMFETIPKFENFREEFGIDPFEYLNTKDFKYSHQYFIASNYSPLGGRQFFTEKNAIKIDGIEISEDEYLRRVKITDESDFDYCDEFLELFDCLGIDSPDEEDLANIDNFVERVSIAYLNFIDFMDFERVDQYVC